MGNCLFAFPDRLISTPQVTVALSSGSWEEDLPLTNLQDASDTRMSKLARSTDLDPSSTLLQGDLGANRDIRVFAICRHNASPTATVRLRLFSDAACTNQVLDTGYLPFWSTFYPPGALNWGHPSLWTGEISEEDRNGYKFDFLHVLDAPVVCRGFKVYIVDSDNTDGYFEMSRCILAPGWQPAVNINWGAAVQWVDPTTSERTMGGVKTFDRRTKYRSLNGELATMTPEAGVGAWFEMQRRLGVGGEFFFVFDPDDTYQAQKLRSFLATFQRLDPLTEPYFGNTQGAFSIEEVL